MRRIFFPPWYTIQTRVAVPDAALLECLAFLLGGPVLRVVLFLWNSNSCEVFLSSFFCCRTELILYTCFAYWTFSFCVLFVKNPSKRETIRETTTAGVKSARSTWSLCWVRLALILLPSQRITVSRIFRLLLSFQSRLVVFRKYSRERYLNVDLQPALWPVQLYIVSRCTQQKTILHQLQPYLYCGLSSGDRGQALRCDSCTTICDL